MRSLNNSPPFWPTIHKWLCGPTEVPLLRPSSATTIRDLEFLRFFPQLRQFSVDVYNLQDASGLQYLPDDLSSFGFGWTVSRRRFSLAPLVRFSDLRSLFLEGHTKDIEAVSRLPRLEALSLRSITLPDLAFWCLSSNCDR
jgi:hypothetical protein